MLPDEGYDGESLRRANETMAKLLAEDPEEPKPVGRANAVRWEKVSTSAAFGYRISGISTRRPVAWISVTDPDDLNRALVALDRAFDYGKVSPELRAALAPEERVREVLDEARRRVRHIVESKGAIVGTPDNWIAPYHACVCGRSLNWHVIGNAIEATCENQRCVGGYHAFTLHPPTAAPDEPKGLEDARSSYFNARTCKCGRDARDHVVPEYSETPDGHLVACRMCGGFDPDWEHVRELFERAQLPVAPNEPMQPTECVFCRKPISAEERREDVVSDTCQLHDGRWACSEECYTRAVRMWDEPTQPVQEKKKPMSAAPIGHEIRIRASVDRKLRHPVAPFTAQCSCGWAGYPLPHYDDADSEGSAHIMAALRSPPEVGQKESDK